MTGDQEWAELREVERRFLAEDPTFAQAFETRARRLERRDGSTRVVIGAAAVLGVLLLVLGSPVGAIGVVVATVLVGLVWRSTDDTHLLPPPDRPSRP